VKIRTPCSIKRGRGRLWSVAPLVLYLALAFLLFAHTWEAPTRRNIGYPGDPPQFMWFLSWTAFALSHHLSPLVSTYLDYPRGVNLMWNAALLWPGAFLAPVTALLGPVFAYNLLVTLALPLSGWCAYLAIRRWTSRASATIGGLLFAFSPQMAAQGLVHAPVVLALTPPLVLLLLTDLLVQRRWPALVSGGALGVVAAAQVLTWSELLATTALMATVGVILAVALQRDRPRVAPYAGVVLRGALSALVTFLLIAGVPLFVEFRGPQRIQGLLHQGVPLGADLLNFVVPTPTQLLTPPVAARVSARFAANVPEANAYLGLPGVARLHCHTLAAAPARPLGRSAGRDRGGLLAGRIPARGRARHGHPAAVAGGRAASADTLRDAVPPCDVRHSRRGALAGLLPGSSTRTNLTAPFRRRRRGGGGALAAAAAPPVPDQFQRGPRFFWRRRRASSTRG